MKFFELLKDVSWEEVKEALLRNYKDAESSIEGYFNIYLKLQTVEPEDDKMRICIDWVEPSQFNDEGYWDVHGRNGDLQKDSSDFKYFKNVSEEVANSEVTYALEFNTWAKWLGMDIDIGTLNNINLMKADIIAHCFWEMSFFSFDEEEIQETKEDLDNRCKEIEKMTDEEIKKNTLSIEEVMERLKGRINDQEEDNEI